MAIQSRNPIADEAAYNQAAREYLAGLPLEHFMESKASALQREITLESLALVRPHVPGFHYFNEMLIQYPVAALHDRGRVVPDNMVVLHDGPIRADTSFNLPFEQARPFWVLEYVSDSNKRKDYVDNMRRYEKDLKVPYYLLFEPDKKQVLLFHLRPGKRKYAAVRPNEHDRLAIPELDLEVGLLGGWVRYWFRGRLLPLPAESEQRADAERRAREAAERRAETAEAEVERLRAELTRLRGGG